MGASEVPAAEHLTAEWLLPTASAEGGIACDASRCKALKFCVPTWLVRGPGTTERDDAKLCALSRDSNGEALALVLALWLLRRS